MLLTAIKSEIKILKLSTVDWERRFYRSIILPTHVLLANFPYKPATLADEMNQLQMQDKFQM